MENRQFLLVFKILNAVQSQLPRFYPSHAALLSHLKQEEVASLTQAVICTYASEEPDLTVLECFSLKD